MEMHEVRYYLALCETLNFTRAAERCHVSQPSLTRAIKALEDEFGGPLFHRERNHTHLTELGRTMQPYLAEVQSQAAEAKGRALGFIKLKDAPLKLGVMCTIGPNRLVGLLSGFRARNEGVHVDLIESNAKTLERTLLDGGLEVTLLASPDPIDERLHAIALYEERFVVAMPPDHRFARQEAVRLEDMVKEPYLLRLNCEFGESADRLLKERGLELNVAYRSEREDWIQAMVLAGLGITDLPESAVAVPGLVTRPLVEPEVSRAVNLVTVRGRPHEPAVGAFVREATRWRTSGHGATRH